MNELNSRRLNIARQRIVKISSEIDNLDPENPIHAFYRASLVKARATYQRQVDAILAADEEVP